MPDTSSSFATQDLRTDPSGVGSVLALQEVIEVDALGSHASQPFRSEKSLAFALHRDGPRPSSCCRSPGAPWPL